VETERGYELTERGRVAILDSAPPWLQILRRLVEIEKDDDDEYGAEIVVDSRKTMLGLDNVPRAILKELLGFCALRSSSDDERGVQRYVLCETGRIVAKHPELRPQIEEAIRVGKSFSVRKNGDTYEVVKL
jgi:hypothetical protein